jgi:hypothetical protein
MDWGLFWTIIGTGIGIVGFIWQILHNIELRLDAKIDKLESRVDSLDEKIFWVITGRNLKEAILEERMKQENKTPKTNP